MSNGIIWPSLNTQLVLDLSPKMFVTFYDYASFTIWVKLKQEQPKIGCTDSEDDRVSNTFQVINVCIIISFMSKLLLFVYWIQYFARIMKYKMKVWTEVSSLIWLVYRHLSCSTNKQQFIVNTKLLGSSQITIWLHYIIREEFWKIINLFCI